jgi:hypothetical protein
MYRGGFGGRRKTGQTALSRQVILHYDETKKNAQPFYNMNTTDSGHNEHYF